MVHRDGFKHAAECGDKLVDILRAKGPDATVDINQACLSETVDTIGLFSFRYRFNGLRHVSMHSSRTQLY